MSASQSVSAIKFRPTSLQKRLFSITSVKLTATRLFRPWYQSTPKSLTHGPRQRTKKSPESLSQDLIVQQKASESRLENNPNNGINGNYPKTGINKEREMKNEVATREQGSKLPSTEFADMNSLLDIGSQDLLIPKILPMQGLSQLVTSGQAQMGELRNSVSGELMGHIDKPMEFYPIFLKKSWDIHKKQQDGQFKYEKNIPVVENPQDPAYNAKMDRLGVDPADGVEVKRVYRYDYFVLLPKDLQEGTPFPYVLSFKSSSRRNGQKIISEWGRMVDARKPFFSLKFNLFGKRDKNEKGTFIVLDVQRVANATQEEMEVAASWINRLKSATNIKVDESDVEAEVEAVDRADTVSSQF